MNKIQYISYSHTSKEMAKHHKSNCNVSHAIFLKDMTFDEVGDLLDNGQIFTRVGNETDFVAIDIDATTVNIRQVLEKFKDDENYRISYGASNSPLKYHILVKLDRTITADEYEQVLEEEFEKVKNACCGRCDTMILDKNAARFHQCFFGQSVENETEIVLEGSKRLYTWCKKDDKEPLYYNETKEAKQHPSMNSADYCKKNGLLTIKEEKRFDVVLPAMTNGRMKNIAEGHRYNWCRMTGTKILMRIFHLNHTFGENWTKWDFLDTVEWAFRTNIVKPDEFKQEMKSLLLWLDNKWDILVTKTYEEQCTILEPYFDCAKRQYKSRGYNSAVMSQLIYEHQFDNNTIVFTSKEELMNTCTELMIDFYGFINFAKSVHFEVAYECITEHKNKKYDCTGMNKEQFDEYCKENDINKANKSRLKKKYNIV